MLGDATPIPTIAVSDLIPARKFYEGVLGLTVKEEKPEAQLVVYSSGQGSIQVYASETAGTNKATYLTWEVDDVATMVEDLKAQGVVFERYPDMPGVTLVGDVHTWGDEKTVWFKDPDGNILCLHQND